MPSPSPTSPGNPHDQNVERGTTLQGALVKWWLTPQRIAGYARHAATWLAGWLTVHGLIDGTSAPLIIAAVVKVSMIVWSWNDGKQTVRQKANGLVRHVFSIVGSIIVFKGWLSGDAVTQIMDAAIGFIGVSTLSGTAGEKYIPQPEPVEMDDDDVPN